MEEPTATMSDSNADFDGTDPKTHLMSPWPPFVAVGLVVAEIGIVLNLIPLAVGGVVLFGGSVAGILWDASVTETPWPSLGLLGGLFAVLGTALWTSQVQTYTLEAIIAVATTNGIAIRGEAVLVGGVLLVVGAVLGTIYEPLEGS